MDRYICLEIMEGYGMGPQAQCILHIYWDRLLMVDSMIRYYVVAFKDFRGLIQGELLSPTIFNVVVDAVVRHWFSLVAELEEYPEGRGMEVQSRADSSTYMMA